MKKLKFYIGAVLVAAVSCAGFTSCGDDDDDNGPLDPAGSEIAAPAFEKVAAKYVLEANSADIQSIELTGSGNYIVMQHYNINSTVRETARKSRVLTKAMFKAVPMSRSYTPIVEGKFTEISENHYKLEGYGTLIVVADENGAYRLEIELEDGTTVDAVAQKAEAYPSSTMTDNLCRTWIPSQFGYAFNYNGKTLFEGIRPVGELRQLVIDYVNAMNKYLDTEDRVDTDEISSILDDFESMIPTKVIFTKTGTYAVFYDDGELAISTWRWVDESKGSMGYSWNYDDEFDPDEAGTVSCSFPNGTLKISEAYTDREDGDVTTETVTWIFTQAK